VEPGLSLQLLAFLSNLHDANERANELMEMIKLHRKRDTLAVNLTYAEQRALEIGITIGGGASVILLDEPTAGMSNSETALHPADQEGHRGQDAADRGARHGRGLRLADKIAVVVYGEVIALTRPKPCVPTPECRKPIWDLPSQTNRQERIEMLKINDLHAYYGKSHVLHGVDFEVHAGEIVACWGATARAAPPRPRPSWGWCTGRGRWTGRART
jgi:ABC-type uncharacterized transport system ATPase subunit